MLKPRLHTHSGVDVERKHHSRLTTCRAAALRTSPFLGAQPRRSCSTRHSALPSNLFKSFTRQAWVLKQFCDQRVIDFPES